MPVMLKALVMLCVTFAISVVYYSGNVFVDNKYYINREHSEGERKVVGKIISTLQQRANALVKHVKADYPTNNRTNRLVNRWKDNIIHELEHSIKDTFAYNINKGGHISVCVHDENNKLNTINEMFFVIMHEMSHIMTHEYEHNDEFWESFRILIHTATKYKLFRNVNYGEKPTYFCGHHIDHNPMFDE